MAASAPISAARWVWRMVISVEWLPVPAIMARFRGMASRAVTRTASRSASDRRGNSPVEPSMTKPSSGVSSQRERLAVSRSVATASPLKGVGTGMSTPVQARISRASADLPGILDLRLGRRQPRDGDHERRARHVRHPDAMAELHRRGLPAVLPADADLEARGRPPAALDADPDQLAHPFLVQHGEGVVGQDLLLEV